MKRRQNIFRQLIIAILILMITTPALHAQDAEDKSELAKKLIVKVIGPKNRATGEQKLGAGIIFNVRGGYLFIATAYHVIQGIRAGDIVVEGKFWPGVSLNAKLYKTSQPLDLAVLRVDIRPEFLRGIPLNSIPFELLKPDIPLHLLDEVFPIGHPLGHEWYQAVSPGRISSVDPDDPKIQFEFDCLSGHSGGGIFTHDWNLVGMVLKDYILYCEALSFKSIRDTLEDDWELEVSRERIRQSIPTPTPSPAPSASELNQKKIQELLKKADAYFARQWYTTPEATSALPIYLEVLSLDPLNAQALEKIDWMAEYYKNRAEKELKRGRKTQAIQAYQTYLTIVPNDDEILDKVVGLTATPTPFPTTAPTQKPTATPQPKATVTPEPLPTATPRPTATAQASVAPTAGQEYHDPISGIDFVWIPKGCFQMGCVSGMHCEKDETPVHEVCLNGFWMGETEVTQAQWKKVMDHNPSNFKDDTLPVEQISWNTIQKYLKQLNTLSKRDIYRLPSEAEWEYAARAGTRTVFNFGNDNSALKKHAWYASNSNSKTHPVGQLSPNNWGLYDMYGNVSEWCQDWYDAEYYTNSPKNNPKGASPSGYRVLRGGAWVSNPGNCRSASRGRVAEWRSVPFGFRVVVGGDVVAWTFP